MWGGFGCHYYESFKKIAETDAPMFVLKYPVPPGFLDMNIARAKKKTASTCKDAEVEVLEKVKEKTLKMKVITPESCVNELNSGMAFGDSHVYGVAPHGMPVTKIAGRTLYGSLVRDENGLNMFDKEYSKTKAKHVLFSLGSIDIRHHIFRQENPILSMMDMLHGYVLECEKLLENGKELIEIVTPIPVETETRKFSKDNAYKGTFFYGSRAERLAMTLFFINYISQITEDIPGIKITTYPLEWYHEPPEEFEKKMERVRGTHLSMNYCRRLNWGKPNEIPLTDD